jgi:hypothetical protein
VGQDVGQFLNGSLTNMDNPTLNKFKDFFKAAPHSHSSYAYSILATLAIGKVYKDGQTLLKNHNQTTKGVEMIDTNNDEVGRYSINNTK